MLSRGAVATAAQAADITDAGEWQPAPLTPPTRLRVPPRYVALREATARAVITAGTGGGLCGGYQCGRAFRRGYVQGTCTSGRLACGRHGRLPPPMPPPGPEALFQFWGLAGVADWAAGESGCVEARGRRLADAEGLRWA